MRDDRCVLAALDRELDADPVLAALLSRFDGAGRPAAGSGTARALLTAGLAIQIVGCVTLSVPVAAVGVVMAVLALWSSIRGWHPRR